MILCPSDSQLKISIAIIQVYQVFSCYFEIEFSTVTMQCLLLNLSCYFHVSQQFYLIYIVYLFIKMNNRKRNNVPVSENTLFILLYKRGVFVLGEDLSDLF